MLAGRTSTPASPGRARVAARQADAKLPVKAVFGDEFRLVAHRKVGVL